MSKLLRQLVDGAALAAAMAVSSPVASAPGRWVETWAAAPDRSGSPIGAVTIRQIVRVSAGGTRIRLRLSNLFGKSPLRVGSLVVAPSAGGARVEQVPRRQLTFGGRTAVTIPAGKDVLTDAAAFGTRPLERIAISVYLPEGSRSPTQHGVGLETAFMAVGDQTQGEELLTSGTARTRFFLTDVQISSAGGSGTIMVVGDSITDGVGSSFGRDARWPDVLATRIQGDASRASLAIANAGISGNRLLNDGVAPFIGPSAVSRFERDALGKPGVRWVLLFEGINDIGASALLKTAHEEVSAAQIIEGMQALIARAHKRGVAVMGTTLLPTGGVGEPFDSPAGEAKRQAVNAWVRAGGGFDAVVDLDQALRDVGAPGRLSPDFDSGDHLHPNDRGYEAIADAVHAKLLALGPDRVGRMRPLAGNRSRRRVSLPIR